MCAGCQASGLEGLPNGQKRTLRTTFDEIIFHCFELFMVDWALASHNCGKDEIQENIFLLKSRTPKSATDMELARKKW
jgi:hypothetical protein